MSARDSADSATVAIYCSICDRRLPDMDRAMDHLEAAHSLFTNTTLENTRRVEIAAGETQEEVGDD